MNKRTRAEDFIAKAKAVHGNRYGYAQTVFANWKTPVVIECPIHGPFRQWPETHLRGAGCKRCKAAKAMEAKSKEAARAFVGRAREMHGDKYDYSKAEYKASNEKVVIICPTHGDFLQTPANHMYGRGCPSCARQHIAAKLAAKPLAAQTSQAPEVLTQAFIKKARAVHGDKYRYEGVRFVNGRTPVEIVCPEHGPFFQLPSPHLAGAGCKSCADKARGIEKNRKAAAEFRNRARAVHGNKYDYLQTTYARSSQKVEIVCLKHGPFFIRPDHFLRGIGCPSCGVESMAAKQATGLAEFVRQSRETHGTKYDYAQAEYVSALKPLTIICPFHGLFRQRPSEHLRGRGCPKCGIEKQAATMRGSTDEFIAKARVVHGTKYDYAQVEYVSALKPLTIICPIHGSFRQKPQKHTSGQGCPSCANRDMSLAKFILRAQEIHGEKYDYSRAEYTRARAPILIVCPEHGPFKQRADHHLKGIGCPLCVNALNSRGVRRIESWLASKGVAFEREKTFPSLRSSKRGNKTLRFDFYLPGLNVLVEFDGQQHFQPNPQWGGEKAFRELVANDRRKDEWAQANGIPLVRVRHDEESEIERILGEKFCLS